MRQWGVLAAGARYALAHHRSRLADDHAHAKLFATRLADAKRVHVDPGVVETNIVNIDLDVAADAVAKAVRELGVAINTTGPKRLRAVTHLDVSREEVLRAAELILEATSRVDGA